jgi:hypothetical protein
MYYYHHPLVSYPTKMNIYIVYKTKNGVSCLTTVENKRQLTISYGGRNHEQQSLQAGILKNCDD